jgi:ADP-ribose pyrophosphatase YjhB (NUDIX family)
MNLSTDQLNQLSINIDHWVPGHSVDCVIFGFEDQKMKVLILKLKGINLWTLPGGFVRKNQNLDEAAISILKERVSFQDVFLNQFHTFGGLDRKDLDSLHELLGDQNKKLLAWLGQRFITTCYFALLNIKSVVPQPDPMSNQCKWVDLNNLPILYADHKEIIHKAFSHIRIQLNYLPFGLSLLPEFFTMTDLQSLYESLLIKKLDRGNFQKKMLKLGIFERHKKKITGGAHRAPFFYSFNLTAYNKLLKDGIGFM